MGPTTPSFCWNTLVYSLTTHVFIKTSSLLNYTKLWQKRNNFGHDSLEQLRQLHTENCSYPGFITILVLQVNPEDITKLKDITCNV